MSMDVQRRWIALLVSLLALCAGARAETLSVRADYWYPLNGTPGSERPGFAIEILRRIFSPHGIQLDYQLADWNRSLEMVREGRIHCVVGAYKAEAPELRYPRTPLARDVAAFYVRADSDWRYQGTESLAGVSLGLVAGYGYGHRLDDYIMRHRGDSRLHFMHGQDPLRRNLKKLMRGRVDVLVASPFVMASLLKRMELQEQVREAGRSGHKMPLYLACSPEYEAVDEHLRLFDEGMARLREHGVLAEIYRRYGIGPEAQAEMRARWPGSVPDAPYSPAETGLPGEAPP